MTCTHCNGAGFIEMDFATRHGTTRKAIPCGACRMADERARELTALRAASPLRSTTDQDDPASLALFAPALEPRLL